MAAARLEMYRLQELVRLHRQGVTVREVARLLGMSPNTERPYRLILERAGLLAGDPNDIPSLEILKQLIQAELSGQTLRQPSVSSVAAWTSEVEQMLGRRAGPRAIYDALRLRPDFKGSLSAIKRLCARLNKTQGVSPEDVAIPVETPPGDVAQVDFGYVGRLLDPLTGMPRQAWVFVMVLGYSRHMFAEIAFDQKVETFIDLHLRAFAYFGGVPKTLVPDNLKAAVIRAAFNANDDCELNRSYRELARVYGFKIDPTPPHAPKKKGKVESAVKYIKRNFFRPREFRDVVHAREELVVWLRDVAAVRIHGTTGQTPNALFTMEKEALLALPTRPFELVTWKQATVHPDTHVFFDRRLYSVPWRLIHQQVWVRATPSTVCIYFHDERVATHARRGSQQRSTIEGHLPEHRRDYRQRQRSYWEQRALSMGQEVLVYIQAVFDSDDVLYQLRTVQSMVKHLETFPRSRAVGACQRALYFGNYKYRGLKEILRKALDLEPLPCAANKAPAETIAFQFARRPSEFQNPQRELFVSHGEIHEYH